MNPIILDPLDTDLYKFTMQQVAVGTPELRKHVRYRFKCRTAGFDYRPFAPQIREQVQAMAGLRFEPGHLGYLESLGHFRPEYLSWLKEFRFDPAQVEIRTAGGYDLQIVGLWEHVILWETPLLAIHQEVASGDEQGAFQAGIERLRRNTTNLPERAHGMLLRSEDVHLCEFGTRRRYSRRYQAQVLEALQALLPDRWLMGTSNVALARVWDLPCIGTQAHEYYQMWQAVEPNLALFVRRALDHWLQFYRGRLGIALTDIIPTWRWLGEFDGLHARGYDGLRQDSGDPDQWARQVLRRYTELGVNPRAKTVVFSDSLDFPRAMQLTARWAPYFGKVVTAIGTNLTCDMGAAWKAIQNVLKLVEVDGKPVAKLADDPCKGMCENPAFEERLRAAFGL